MGKKAAASKNEELGSRLVELFRDRLPRPHLEAATQFARHFYARAPWEDLENDAIEDLYGAALAYWNLTRVREADQRLVRIYNPSVEAHGWQSTHTVVEIVQRDSPFLVDSVTMELNRHGLTVHRIVHPVLWVERDEQGAITAVSELESGSGQGGYEATMRYEVDRRTDPELLARLETSLNRVLDDVAAAVRDWQAMVARMRESIESLATPATSMDSGEVAEASDFLRWVADNHFTFLGFRSYTLSSEGGQTLLRADAGSGLGILRQTDAAGHVSKSFLSLTPEQRQLAFAPNPLVLSKANARSTVHRPAHLDYIGIKRFDGDGNVIGEWRFLGLYTSLAYSMSPTEIPLLRRKVQQVLERARLQLHGHAGKALHNILDTFPRDDLFQATIDELHDISMGILHLQERQRLRLFVRPDPFGRFVSCIVYVPRERYNTELRVRMQQVLLDVFDGGSCEFTTQFSESVLARVLFHVRTRQGQLPEYDLAETEARLREAMLSWTDGLQRALLEHHGEERGNALFLRYQEAFPAAYREDFPARLAVPDVGRLESVSDTEPLAMHLYRPAEDPDGMLRFKVFGAHRSIPLSDVLPMLERLGLRVLATRPYEVEPEGRDPQWILDFDMTEAHGIRVEAAEVKEIFQEAFARVWNGELESDGLNRLVLAAGLPWRGVAMLRAYTKYLLQTRVPFSQEYMQRAVTNHPAIARLLAELFHARFEPALEDDRAERCRELVAGIEAALDRVSNLDEDRILRRYLAGIQATLRTNFFQTSEGRNKPYISFKIDPARIPDMPLPRPMFEIFVYSPRVEGVHLRGGSVARGGLRWSDRREDFRTEVLGLMKAQMVKNAVIVPMGSKGGFVVKQPPEGGTREQLQAEVVACYQTFIRGLLDLTDNLVSGTVQPPPELVRHDSDDPYLVVAADKGTATFSDIANAIAEEYGFWLGDAFASGGSVGYDHKKMGITARGGWESVKRHFRELGVDTQTTDFTVVGIGDMAGDVFGNGMLLSRHIRLLAAFNHMHIFLDPEPDAETSYLERERLFALPRSSWEDYDKSLISAGGGIYARSAKSIPISSQVREALGIEADKLTPNELIQAILKAPVDLLWNGGIGTYVKAGSESHTDVGDRANDALRINGRELRCKVVGEGGNLGLTQLGRIEYARTGGRVYTDFIDNSGGVDCSDHEVNIKILLNRAVANGDLTLKQRNELLVQMTDEVAGLVLRDNYLQSQAISVTRANARDFIGDQALLIRALERAGKLNRPLEYLPGDEEIAERQAAGQGLVGPEMAVLLAYSKIDLFQELVASDVPEDPYLEKELVMYFPLPLQQRFRKEMESHPLRREIIATHVTNSMLNRMGSTYAFRLNEETGASAPEITRAYAAAREIYEARRLWGGIEALDNRVPASLQIDMIMRSRQLLERASLWLLRNRRSPLAIDSTVAQFAEGIATLAARLPELLPPTEAAALQATVDGLVEAGVPEEVGRWVAGLEGLYSGLDIIEVAQQGGLQVETVAGVYYGVVSLLELDWLGHQIAALPAANHWQSRARSALVDGLYQQQRSLTGCVLASTPDEAPVGERLQAWAETNRGGMERCRSMFDDLRAASRLDLAMLSVALRETASLSQSS